MKPIGSDMHSSATPVSLRRSRIGFTKKTERQIFFIMTLVMLVAGVLYKIGVW
jgi:hypothetical protein